MASVTDFDRAHKIATWSELKERTPTYGFAAGVDVVLIRFGEEVSVLYGRCLHRGALLADGRVEGDNLICGLHDWDYRFDSGISEYNNDERLQKFSAWVSEDDDAVYVDESEIAAWAEENPQPYQRDEYLGLYEDVHGAEEEPHRAYIKQLATEGLSKLGHHGRVAAMGVPRQDLPKWEDIQLITAQLARRPLLDDEEVGTDVVIGKSAKKPLTLRIPIFVSDMSFGALSEEAKTALARGAEFAGTGICSGEGGMLPEEQAENSRYFYELASGRFGWSLDKVKKVQAFHFKAGQGAKTGTGGHLPGHKVKGRIAEIRNLEPGTPAISPSTFPDLKSIDDFKQVADEVRETNGGIPIGVKMSAQHIEQDIDWALELGVDYIILDGRGGGTGAAPLIFRDNISVPTMAALACARKHLDDRRRPEVSLVITGGLRTESDFVKALALGADAIAVANSAIQAIGCLGMRACNTNNCPVGIATMREDLRRRFEIKMSARRLQRYFDATVELMQVLARACGHRHLREFSRSDLVTWSRDMAYLTGVAYAGVTPL